MNDRKRYKIKLKGSSKHVRTVSEQREEAIEDFKKIRNFVQAVLQENYFSHQYAGGYESPARKEMYLELGDEAAEIVETVLRNIKSRKEAGDPYFQDFPDCDFGPAALAPPQAKPSGLSL